MGKIELQQSRDISALISDTFGYVREHFKTFFKAILLFALPLSILSGIIIGDGYSSFLTDIITDSESANPNMEMAGFFQIMGGLVLFVFNYLIIILMVLRHVQLVNNGETDFDFSVFVEGMSKNIFGLMGVYFLTIVAVSIGFILFIVPGIIIAIKLSLAPSVYIMEEETVLGAISKSWTLTDGYWWVTFALNLVMSLILNFASYIFIIPMMVIVFIVGFNSATPEPSFLSNMIGIVYGLMIVMTGLLYSIPVLAQAIHYFNLNERKNAFSLQSKVEMLRRD